jgi:pyruvate dehydrogenase E2 component (dihydrolipoamide acetyltransferase)
VTDITKLGMPKWGLSMTEGRIVEWLVDEGATVAAGEEVAEVETEKINGAVEAPAGGVLRRRVAAEGAVVPVGGLVGVIAPADVPDADVDAFVAEFQASFVPEEAAEDAAPPTETVEVGGRRLRFLRRGEGPSTVLFLHGFGGDLNNWLFNSEKLAEGQRQVLALDLPGHGESSKDVGDGDLDTLVAAVRGFLDAVGVDRAHLVGHSMGGAIALGLALTEPERVASLTLVASAGLGDDINADYIDGFVAAGRRRELKSVLELLFADPSLVTRQLVDDVLRYKRIDGVDPALRTIASAWFPSGRQATVLASRLPEVAVPVLAIFGSADQIVPTAHADAVRDHARVEVLAGQGHSPHMEGAGQFNRLLGDFLDSQE